MKATPTTSRIRCRQGGWALLVVITLSACAIMLLASVMQWAYSNDSITAQSNEEFATAYAAEAATEKALAGLSQDYQNYGFSEVNSSLTRYATNVPNTSDNAYWGSYLFGSGTSNGQLLVFNATPNGFTNVIANNSAYAAYAGLTFSGNTYEIVANAQNTNTSFEKLCTVGQQVSLGTIDLFQFAIFFQNDMEIEPGAAMTVSGPVHGNANIYLVPSSGLVFSNNISGVGGIYTNQSPNDPTTGRPADPVVTFDGLELNYQPPLNLPVSTNNDVSGTNASASGYGILELPVAGQTPSSAAGSNLLYNQADLIIIISNNNTISVTSGAGINNQATVISNSQYASWLSTNGSFTDQRDDNLTVNPVVLNISNLVIWSSTNTNLSTALASVRPGQGSVQSIYIADLRSTSNATVTTNYTYGTNYSTNTVTNSSLPTAGTYVPPITSTNTTSTTNSSYPGANTYLGSVTTNTSTTTNSGSSLPTSGTYLPPIISTNVTLTTNTSSPSSGTYTGSVTHSGSHYIYDAITGYTYKLITGYTYNLITSYTYQGIIGTAYTNMSCITNWTTVSQPGVVLSNGAALPPQGLSIATPDPAYILGNWNIKQTNTSSAPSDAGLNSTTYTEPSAIYADAITVLSPAWKSANSGSDISSRVASSDTVNAAFFTGNVPSTTNGPNAAYSGGVENFPRFLEDWSGQTFTYNGSMVQMFNSQIATNAWPGTGAVYNPPTRDWAFDQNFSNPAKQPPLTPRIIAVQRSQWALLTPRATAMTNLTTY